MAMPTSAGRGVATDSENFPTGETLMFGVAHHSCVDNAFVHIRNGLWRFEGPLTEVVAERIDRVPPFHLPPGPSDCLFCDRFEGGQFTNEHVWSEWFQRELFALGARFPSYGRGKEAAPLGPTVRVCIDCNNRWMSVLENDAKPLIVDMWHQPRTLDLTEQRLLATWATKTAIVLDAIEPRLIPRHFGHELRVSRRPASGVWVWATMIAGGPPNLSAWLRPLRLAAKGQPTPEDPNGLCVTFTLHRIAFQVVFAFYRGQFDVPLRYDCASMLTPLWPPDGGLKDWPCGGFDEEALQDVAERFATES